MRTIKELSIEELFELANLATNGYFNGEWSRGKKEVETGGYGLRRRIEWVMNLEGYNEYHSFIISSESKSIPWVFSCKSGTEIDSVTGKPKFENNINICNITKIVDYCRENMLDIDNINELNASIIDNISDKITIEQYKLDSHRMSIVIKVLLSKLESKAGLELCEKFDACESIEEINSVYRELI